MASSRQNPASKKILSQEDRLLDNVHPHTQSQTIIGEQSHIDLIHNEPGSGSKGPIAQSDGQQMTSERIRGADSNDSMPVRSAQEIEV